MKPLFIDLTTLAKLNVSSAVSITALVGFIVSTGKLTTDSIPLVTGTFLMAAGASALNHVAERSTDSQMERTKKRPVASKRIGLLQAITISSAWLGLGWVLLYFYFSPIVPLLGLTNAFWYIAIYTPLKRVTPWALFAGTLTGVIPFFMGFLAFNTHITPLAIFTAFFLLIWQIPHFLIILTKYAHEYSSANLKPITEQIRVERINRIIYIWLIACSISTLLIPINGLHKHTFVPIIYSAMAAISIVILVSVMLKPTQEPIPAKGLSILTHSLQVIFLATLVLDSLL
ncbi:MAG: UbiA family prenyltransferase [Tenuifilaceae bacterium]|nr:UbiA family prenyltransferase [Tenuifilaceae bacterium]